MGRVTSYKTLTVSVPVDGEHLDHFVARLVALKFLAIEQFLFENLDGLARLDESLRDASIAATVAGGDQIGDATRLKKGRHQEALGKEGLAEANHLLEANSNDSRLGVVTQAKAIGKASCASDNIL